MICLIDYTYEMLQSLFTWNFNRSKDFTLTIGEFSPCDLVTGSWADHKFYRFGGDKSRSGDQISDLWKRFTWSDELVTDKGSPVFSQDGCLQKCMRSTARNGDFDDYF